jgi:DNA-binding GntR family transcriptional regulator
MKQLWERDFKGVWIPREIWLSAQLSLMEKVLFVEISSLDNERGCFASNAYFAEFFGVSDRQIRNVIGGLKSKGFVTVSVQNKNARIIRTAGKYRRVSAQQLAELSRARAELERGMRFRTATGVGRKLPGR